MERNKPSVKARDRTVWRKWLERNHQKKNFVWLILYHQTSKTRSIRVAEAVEEALCFGWIDSTPNKRDHESYYIYYARRKPGSVWSKINKERVERLIASGAMTEAGMARIREAKEDGSWETLDSIDRMEMPEALEKGFRRKKRAKDNFLKFPPSVKKQIYHWINTAKTPETRRKRIQETVSSAAKNIRANQWTKPK